MLAFAAKFPTTLRHAWGVSSEQPVRSQTSPTAGNRAACAPRLRARDARHKLLPFALAALASTLGGCGHFAYSIQVNSAASRLEEARELGAEKYAPYEYYMAKEHLEKARSEAAEADYGDASSLSEDAEEYAAKAVALSREAHRGAGR